MTEKRQPTHSESGPDTQDAPHATRAPSDDEAIAELAALSELEYDRVRVERARQLGVQVKTLDALVKAARSEEPEAGLPFPDVEPHPDPVDPAQLLDDLSATVKRFIVLRAEQADAVALWTAMTWFIDVIEVAPLAIINAPEKACGKSQLLDLVGRMSARPLPAANSSVAFLFRAVELWTPTLLIDELDTFIRENDEIKGLINAGYTRANAFVGRVVGNNFEPKLFGVWGAKALAAIALERHLPDATMSRAIVFELRRKLPHENVTPLRRAEAGLFNAIASRLARFAMDCSEQVRRARPSLPDTLGDRDQDNWEPLLAIAECAGPVWVQRATEAALKLSSANKATASTGNELLADIQEIFERKGVEKISTADLIEKLVANEEGPWATYNRGKPISPRQLARQLSVYGISSKTVRLGPFSTPKGFDAAQFRDAFARYLAPPPPLTQQCNDLPEPSSGEKEGVSGESQRPRNATAGPVADGPPQNATRNASATQAAMQRMGGGAVADDAPRPQAADRATPEATTGNSTTAPDPQGATGMNSTPQEYFSLDQPDPDDS